MASIRDLVAALRQREGVDAAIVLGRDGLVIDSQTDAAMNAEDVAARIPSIVGPADELGTAAGRGEVVTVILEHHQGIALVSVLSAEAILLVLVQPNADIGQLLYEIRRNREHIAALV